MAYGVTGNTSDFGSEESRFDPSRPTKKQSNCSVVIHFYWCDPQSIMLLKYTGSEA